MPASISNTVADRCSTSVDYTTSSIELPVLRMTQSISRSKPMLP
jgi:hypothetical protein